MSVAYVVRFDNCVAIDATYKRDFVAEFKQAIPAAYRMWHQKSGCWAAWAPWCEHGAMIACRIYGVSVTRMNGIKVMPPPGARKASTHEQQDPFKDHISWNVAWETWLVYKDQAERKRQMEEEKERLRREQARRKEGDHRQGYGSRHREHSQGRHGAQDPFGRQRSGYSYQNYPPPPPPPRQPSSAVSTGHYRVLFVTNDAPKEVITGAYRALAKLHHTDVAGKDEEEAMKDINVAYEQIRKGWS